MALFETHYYSYTLGSNITLNVIIPTPKSGEDYHMMGTEAPYLYKEGIPVLYLLHGANGDAFSWMRYSSIERYAQDHGLAVVMCSAENSFYLDLPYGLKYKTFFTEELPHFICSLFPVTLSTLCLWDFSTARQNTVSAQATTAEKARICSFRCLFRSLCTDSTISACSTQRIWRE